MTASPGGARRDGLYRPVDAKRRDLVISAVSLSEPVARPGTPIRISSRTLNAGSAIAKSSVTGYVFSVDASRDPSDPDLGVRRVAVLRAGQSAVQVLDVVVPRATRQGTYRVVACADMTDRVKESDESNNCRTSAAIRVGEPDTVPPPPPRVSSGPPNPTNVATATLDFVDDEVGVDLLCRVDETPFAPCLSPVTFAALSDGEHSFAVKARDAARNESAATTYAWRIDTRPPDAPTVVSRPAAATRDTEATFAFSLEPGATALCRLDGATLTTCVSPTAYSGLGEGDHTFSAVARDAAGNVSDPVSIDWRVDRTAPFAPTIVSHPPSLTNQTTATFEFTSAEIAAQLLCRLDGREFAACTSPSAYTGFADGPHIFAVKARDAAGNESLSSQSTWVVDTAPPVVTITSHPTDRSESATASFVFDSEPGASFTCKLDAASPASCDSPKTYEALPSGAHSFEVRATDAAGNASPPAGYTWTLEPAPPPDPATVATRLDESVPTSLVDSTRFLYSGSDPVQTGVTPGAIVDRRAAVVRGRVLTRGGDPLPGVEVSVLGHAELGRTESRTDGRYDLVVNGGGTVVVSFRRDGFLPAQRQVDEVAWDDYTVVPDLVLVRLDDKVTRVDLADSASTHVAQGSRVTDDDGTRQATLIFPPGVTATMTVADGSSRTLSTMHVRATEYTVGDRGPEAMPAELPPTSQYTYAVEFSADEAIAGGGAVEFSRPISAYVDNFLELRIGELVPLGSYDPRRGTWVPLESGAIVEIVDEVDGMALVDADGDGQADTAAALAALGITSAERVTLATLYDRGKQLWRVAVPRFGWKPSAAGVTRSVRGRATQSPPPAPTSPYDANWGVVEPDDATSPNADDPADEGPDERNHRRCGSIILCESQILAESTPVTGTAFSLVYATARTPGFRTPYRLTIPLSGPRVPASLERIHLLVSVAGRQFRGVFNAAPNQTTTFEWDGQDAYGRTVQGRQEIRTRVGFGYTPVIGSTQRFAAYPSSSMVSGTPARTEIVLWRNWKGTIGGFDARGLGLGGWTLSAHHAYDVADSTLYVGDGSQRSAASLTATITTFAGTRERGFSGDGGPATQANIGWADAVAVTPDGSVYIAANPDDGGNVNRVRKVGPDGTITHVTTACGARALTVGPDGSVYIAETGCNRIRRIGPAGEVTLVAGGRRCVLATDPCGDGGPATAAQLQNPSAVAVGSDGSVYIGDQTWRVRRVDPSGVIRTVAGTGVACWAHPCGDGGPAASAELGDIESLAVGATGDLYIGFHNRVRRVTRDGTITNFAGSEDIGSSGDGGRAAAAQIWGARSLALGRDGSIYIADTNNARVRRVSPEGVITTVAGGSTTGFGGDGGVATAAGIAPFGIAIGPDDTLYIAEGPYRDVRRVHGPFSGFAWGDLTIPSEDGSEIYRFDATGRHRETREALTGALLLKFSYDGAGRLASAEDGDGNMTTMEHDASGQPTAIVAPGGQRTELASNAAGFLETIANPAAEQQRFDYNARGLLMRSTDARGSQHHFAYDSDGRLVRDEDPAGGFKTLKRSGTPRDYTVTVTTALGRSTAYRVQRTSDGGERRTVESPTGAATVTKIGPDLRETTEFPDGMIETLTPGPDPRFGMLAPRPVRISDTTPGGLTRVVTARSTAKLADPGNPFALEHLSETFSINGREFTVTFDGGSRTLTTTSVAGRVSRSVVDAMGRVVETTIADAIEPIRYRYGSHGLVADIRQGDATTAYTYDERNRLATVTTADGRTTSYEYDKADRPVRFISPSGRVHGVSYDAAGNPGAIHAPNGSTHELSHDTVGAPLTYRPPENAAYTWEYNTDGRTARRVLPSGASVDIAYDAAGRFRRAAYPDGVITHSYVDPTERISELARVSTNGLPQTMEVTYDGPLVTSVRARGFSDEAHAYTYDNDFRLRGSITTAGGESRERALAYDPDGLLEHDANVSYARGGPGGAVSRITDETLDARLAYDTKGRLAKRTYEVAGRSVYVVELGYETGGRIKTKLETIAGDVHRFEYEYDVDGQLSSVTRDGRVVERYEYDVNGNRTSSSAEGTRVSASYDRQDRLTKAGSVDYVFDENGFLAGRGADSFEYGMRGELRTATVGSHEVDYSYDPLGRLIARRDATGRQTYEYADPAAPFRVTSVTTPKGEHVAFRYDSDGILLFVDKGGSRLYVASDERGTPRVVIDQTGRILQTIEFDSFGRAVRGDTSLTAPIGFAGGNSDNLTGLVRFGFRDYDPETGRWTARDPIGFGAGDANLYRYANNDPINASDASGLVPIWISWVPFSGRPGSDWWIIFNLIKSLSGGPMQDLPKPYPAPKILRSVKSPGCGPGPGPPMLSAPVLLFIDPDLSNPDPCSPFRTTRPASCYFQ